MAEPVSVGRKRLAFPSLLLLLFLVEGSLSYYVGPEVGKASPEMNVRHTRFLPAPNATSLAEAAYVPYVYAVGNNVVTFLRSIIPGLQPKVDFAAEQIQDTIDVVNNKLMQKLENSNNAIIKTENFFTGLMKAFVFGKSPEDDERRRRFAAALIRSGIMNVTVPNTTTNTTIRTTTRTTTSTTTPSTTTTTSNKPVLKSPMLIVTDRVVRGVTTTTETPSDTPTPVPSTVSAVLNMTEPPKIELMSLNELEPRDGDKMRDNTFNKMRIMSIMKKLNEM